MLNCMYNVYFEIKRVVFDFIETNFLNYFELINNTIIGTPTDPVKTQDALDHNTGIHFT